MVCPITTHFSITLKYLTIVILVRSVELKEMDDGVGIIEGFWWDELGWILKLSGLMTDNEKVQIMLFVYHKVHLF